MQYRKNSKKPRRGDGVPAVEIKNHEKTAAFFELGTKVEDE